ncbi:arginine--tRNA ligase [Thermodesulfovibrionales bacterium]|nr:arginine--tRNA ligase [Thermodesulfovibrionales bacterium]
MEKILREILRRAVGKIQVSELDHIEIEIPREEGFGDLSTPIAMSLARRLKMPPKKIAGDIINAIREIIFHLEKGEAEKTEIFDKIELAGSGFINFTFTREFLCNELRRLIGEKEEPLVDNIGKNKKIQIEFVSANPTGPMHLGHGRGAALGAALANLLSEAGYIVEKEYYVNDAGRQIKLLGISVFARCNQLSGVDYPFPDDGYRGEYINDLAREFMDEHKERFMEQKAEDVIKLVTDFSYRKMLEAIKRDIEDFGISFDSWQSEMELYKRGEVSQSIEELKKQDYIYEEGGATWFKSTIFGDDKDRVVVKKGGEYTYFAPDIAYHRKKVQKGFDEIINIWGADHHGYIPRIKAVIQALGYPKDSLKILLVQMVSLLKGGRPLQMSKRAGEFITLREVIDEIGADTTKFLFLIRRPDNHLEVDIEVAKAHSHENPVFYVQYAHARINSIFKMAKGVLHDTGYGSWGDFNGKLFNNEEMRIIRKCLLYPMIFKNAAMAREPHRITFYLQEVTGLFHPYYQRHRVVSEDTELTKARLALCEAIRIVLRHGLKILGVKAPERM